MASLAEPAATVDTTAAAARLYELHSSRVLGYCLRALGSREDAEDAAQTTFMQAFRALRRGVVPAFESAWLLTIARNVCLARHRSGSRRRQVEVARDPQDLARAAAPEATESLDGLAEAVGRLPVMQIRAILLREWQGYSYDEIAAELGLSRSAVESLLFRARRNLARELGERRSTWRSIAELGWIASAVKSALGGAASVKVAVGAAAIATVGLAAGSVDTTTAGPQPRPAPAIAQQGASAPATKTIVPRTATRGRRAVGTARGGRVGERSPKVAQTRVAPAAAMPRRGEQTPRVGSPPVAPAAPAPAGPDSPSSDAPPVASAPAPVADAPTVSPPAPLPLERPAAAVEEVVEQAPALPIELPQTPVLPEIEAPAAPAVPELPALP